MSIQSRVSQKTYFNGWQVQNYLGSGSGGRTAVFRMERQRGFTEVCALKVVNIIEETGSWDAMSAEYQAQFERRMQELQQQALREVELMYQLRGNATIVSYLDFQVIRYQEPHCFGCDLLIRMELLQALRDLQKASHAFSEKEIIHIGKDLCRALQVCHRAGIVHRDIKPGNIFLDRNGTYKLGDFGVSRILQSGGHASTAIGTETYAAPEQFLNGYDLRVDIYSLGLTLYELANNNCLPFSSSPFTNDIAIQRRLSGTPLPPPQNAGPALSAVILKACAYNKEGRYRTADELLQALEQAERAPQTVPQPVNPPQGHTSQPLNPPQGRTSQPLNPPQGHTSQPLNPAIKQKLAADAKEEKRKSRVVILGVALIVVVAIAAALLIGQNNSSSGSSLSTSSSTSSSTSTSTSSSTSSSTDSDTSNSADYSGSLDIPAKPDDVYVSEGDILEVLPAGTWQGDDGETIIIQDTDFVSWTFQSKIYTADYISIEPEDFYNDDFTEDQYDCYWFCLMYSELDGDDYLSADAYFILFIPKNTSVENRTVVYLDRDDDIYRSSGKTESFNEETEYTTYTLVS